MRSDSVTVVHLSDVHLGPLPWIPLKLLNAKRLASAFNWLRTRRHVHVPHVADRLRRDVAGLGADQIAVTGDLANVGLPAEIARAAGWLRGLGPPDRVCVVPGNHDIYSTLHGQRLGVAALAPWARYFAPCAQGAPYAVGAEFPFVRVLGQGAVRVALIGLNSAVETPPLVATGELGNDQLQRLGGLLDATRRDGLIRVVMLHHPPLPGLTRPHHELVDAPALEAVLRHHGAELVIHGHTHLRTITPCDGARGRLLCLGVPSASAARVVGGAPLARAHIFQFTRTVSGLRITLIARGLAEPDGPIVELERQVLDGINS